MTARRVDGTTYRYLGNGTEPPLAQRSVKVYPTRTIFELELSGVLGLTLTFLTPMFTDDQLRLSRPVYYIQHTARSLDGAAHYELCVDCWGACMRGAAGWPRRGRIAAVARPRGQPARSRCPRLRLPAPGR